MTTQKLDEFYANRKKRFRGIFSAEDRKYEKLLNDIDPECSNENCCQRVANIISKVSPYLKSAN